MRPPLMWLHPLVEEALIIVEGAVIDQIERYRQDRRDKPEAGGILLGYRREQHIHIIDCTVPQPADKRMRFRFFRQAGYHQDIAARRWQQSGRLLDYVGEWHTHPEPRPMPSTMDCREWQKICARTDAPMVFLIQGDQSLQWLGVGAKKQLVAANPYL